MGDILDRLWYPRRENVDLFRYGSFILLPVGLPLIILLTLFLPGRLATCLLLFLYFGFLILRGIVMVRGAYTLPLDDEKKRGHPSDSAGSGIGMRVLAVCILFLSALGLLLTVEYFFIIFIAMAMASLMAFAHGGLSTVVFLTIAAVLTVVSVVISVIQGGAGGAVASSGVSLIGFPMAFAVFIEESRSPAG